MKARFARSIHHVALLTALILAAATLSIVSPSLASATSPAYVQGASAQVASGTTASVAFPGANSAGNLIVVYVLWNNTGTVTVSDTRATPTPPATARADLGEQLECAGLLRLERPRRVQHGQGDLRHSDSPRSASCTSHEYSGVATASPLDASASAVGTAASMSSGAVSTTSANDLLFAAGASANTVTTPGTGFTARLTGSGNLTEDRRRHDHRVLRRDRHPERHRLGHAAPGVPGRPRARPVHPPSWPSSRAPPTTDAGAAITPAVKVAVEDASGNIETSDNTTQVTLAIGTNPAGGTLSGGSAVTVASGIATFSGLSINAAGTGYTLTASSTPTYGAATSADFNITAETVGLDDVPGWQRP